jgi:hypothetical protein
MSGGVGPPTSGAVRRQPHPAGSEYIGPRTTSTSRWRSATGRRHREGLREHDERCRPRSLGRYARRGRSQGAEATDGSLLVTEGDDLIGIISERDALKAVATRAKLEEARIAEVMTNDVVTVGPRPPCARRPRSWRIGDRPPSRGRRREVGRSDPQRDLAGALNEPGRSGSSSRPRSWSGERRFGVTAQRLGLPPSSPCCASEEMPRGGLRDGPPTSGI